MVWFGFGETNEGIFIKISSEGYCFSALLSCKSVKVHCYSVKHSASVAYRFVSFRFGAILLPHIGIVSAPKNFISVGHKSRFNPSGPAFQGISDKAARLP